MTATSAPNRAGPRVGDTFYRFEDPYYDVEPPRERHLHVVKVTRCGVWVKDEVAISRDWRFIRLGARRAHAYRTREKALEAYRLRKRWRVRHLWRHLDKARRLLAWVEREMKLEPSHEAKTCWCGGPAPEPGLFGGAGGQRFGRGQHEQRHSDA